MNRIFKTVLMTAVFALPVAFALGQVTARQGTPEEFKQSAEPTEFKSPMILEAPLPVEGIESAPNNLPIFFKDFTKFTCEGIAIPIIEFRVLRSKGKAERLEARVHIQNRTSDDKWVDLALEILMPDAPPRRAVLRRIDAESNKRIIRKLELSYEQIAELPQPPLFRVSVSSLND